MGAAAIHRKVWTREEVHLLTSEAFSLELELVNGEVIDKSLGKTPPHNFWKTVLGDWLSENIGAQYVRTGDPIDVAPEDHRTSEPQPDLAVTSEFESIHVNQKPEDLRLVVEVSDVATYDFDTKIKADLYARAGIWAYWVVDVRVPDAPRLIVHLEPKKGQYTAVVAFDQDEDVTVLQGSLTLRLDKLATPPSWPVVRHPLG
jgi:Uma2 family endonuclease